MRKVKQLLGLMLISLLLSGFSKKGNPENWKEQRVVLAGKVLNYEKHRNQNTIQLTFQDLFDRRKNSTISLNEDGSFRKDLLLSYSQDFYLDYGRISTLHCSPGDSLYLEIDADIWKDKQDNKPNGKYYVQVKGGTVAKTNQNILKFLDELPNERYLGSNAINAIKSNTPEEYTKFIYQREKRYREFLERFNKVNKTGRLFRKWADDMLKYESYNDLMRYPWERPYRNQISRDSLRLPKTYFSFLEKYDMNDNGLITFTHGEFLHEYNKYVFKRSLAAGESANAKDNGSEAGKELIKNIRQNSLGFSGEYVLSSYFLLALKAHALTDFEEVYDSTWITNSYFQERIKAEYENQKVYLANQNTKGANILNIESSINSDLIKTVIAKYKGKVVYIDFWGPWCGPCMQEMPYSKEMQQYFKDKDVVFLFLAHKTRDDSWKATIANKELTGEHLNLTNDQFNIFSSEFGITGVPHYTLINKKGDIILEAAPRPSEKESLRKEIEILLK